MDTILKVLRKLIVFIVLLSTTLFHNTDRLIFKLRKSKPKVWGHFDIRAALSLRSDISQ